MGGGGIDLGDPVEDGPGAYLPIEVREGFVVILGELVRLLQVIEPLSAMKVGDADEAVRLGAKETLVAAGLAIEHQRGLLAEAKRMVVGWLDGICIDGELIDLDDLGRFYVGDNAKISYDNTRTASSFAARLADEIGAADPATGAYPPVGEMVQEAVFRTASALGGLTPAKAWNKTPLGNLGLDRDQFIVAKERTDRALREKR